MLILNNIDLPVNIKQSTYESVIEAWRTAISGMEKLIAGQSQRCGNAAVMLGLSSWHIYPDLVVLSDQTKDVRFGDELVVDGGVLSIGVENVESDGKRGLYWSLSLSHLRYYGDPVTVSSSSRESSSLSMDEFQYLVFGSITADWGRSLQDCLLAANFFVSLATLLSHKDGRAAEHLAKANWFQTVVQVSKRILEIKDPENSLEMDLVTLGKRKARTLLSKSYNRPPPYFGLMHPFVKQCIGSQVTRTSVNFQVSMMRFIADVLNLRPDECIIRSWNGSTYDYMTAVRHADCLKGLNPEVFHRRWVSPPGGGVSFRDHILISGCGCHQTGHSCHSARCPCIILDMACSIKCHIEKQKMIHKCFGCQPQSPFQGDEVYSSNECDNGIGIGKVVDGEIV